ncbi:MAG: aminopeptidase P family N-terminal domain-containing protein [Actinobacteria bacterium]|nr:aminopeptidase P family N-terminal domain-containing protein [Actinomycetota bacterium]
MTTVKMYGNSEVDEKIVKLRTLIKQRKLGGILITRQHNFAWITGGRKNQVLNSFDDSLCGVLVTESDVYFLASQSDFRRVLEEELKDLKFEEVLYDWYGNGIAPEVLKRVDGVVGIDSYVNGIADQRIIEADLSDLRSTLSSYEIERIKSFSLKCSEIITEVAMSTKQGESELKVASEIAQRYWEFGIAPSVLMVGSDDRLFKYRHPVATQKKIDKYFMIALVAEKFGLNVSISRLIHFGKPDEDLLKRQKAIENVFAYLISLSKPGISFGDIFEKMSIFYESLGFKDEWKYHLQGGTIAYKPREALVVMDSKCEFRENQLAGWNPTITGVKAEDVYLIKKDGGEIISFDNRWPHYEVEVNGFKLIRPDFLIL